MIAAEAELRRCELEHAAAVGRYGPDSPQARLALARLGWAHSNWGRMLVFVLAETAT